MASTTTSEILHDLSPFLVVYKDGQFERLVGKQLLPPSLDPTTAVQSKDIQIPTQNGLSARLYLPKTTTPHHKLPLLIYFHGGGFLAESAFSPFYHHHLNSLTATANVVAVSVEYRRAPEHPLPIAYDDSWAAVKWVVSHPLGEAHDPWLKEYVDFERVFFGGDSAGGNIAHNLAIRVGLENPGGFKLDGIVLVHPYFCGRESIGNECADVKGKEFVDKLWLFVNPKTSGLDDPLLNPVLDPKLSRLGCGRVLVCVAEKDVLRDRGWYYYEELRKSGWVGQVEVMEIKGEGHVFHLFNPTGDNALAMLQRMASFMNENKG